MKLENLLLLQKNQFTYSALNSIGYNQIIDYLNGLLDYKSLEIKKLYKRPINYQKNKTSGLKKKILI